MAAFRTGGKIAYTSAVPLSYGGTESRAVGSLISIIFHASINFQKWLKTRVFECLIKSATSIIHHMSIDFAVNFTVKIILPF